MIGLALALAHGQLDEQIQLMTRRIQDAPDHARHRLRRGELWRLQGECHPAESAKAWDLAEEDFRKALELDPGLRDVHLAWGRARLAAGRPADALAPLERFLAEDPDHAEARLYLARALEGAGRRAEALTAYDRSIATSSRPAPDVYLERAALWVARGCRADALRGLEEGIERLGPLVALELRALELEAPEAALVRVERWLKRPGRKEEWHLRRAEILARLGRGEDARASAGEALAALEALPPSRREVPAARELERRAREVLR